MLGFSYATKALIGSEANDLYGTAGDNFVLDELKCTGNEASIFDCSHKGEWNHSCWSATEIAGVKCATGE